MHGMVLGNIAEWVGAVGQALTAGVAALIAYLAFRHSKRSMQMNCQKELHDMVSNWNRMILHSDATIAAANRMREPVLGHPDDSIIFSYLNFLRANFEMSNARLISTETERVAIGNGVNWLSKLGPEVLSKYLSRGYDTQFRDRILAEIKGLDSDPTGANAGRPV
jgi:hypothetical protein